MAGAVFLDAPQHAGKQLAAGDRRCATSTRIRTNSSGRITNERGGTPEAAPGVAEMARTHWSQETGHVTSAVNDSDDCKGFSSRIINDQVGANWPEEDRLIGQVFARVTDGRILRKELAGIEEI